MRRIIGTAVVAFAGLALALGQAPPADEESAVRAAGRGTGYNTEEQRHERA